MDLRVIVGEKVHSIRVERANAQYCVLVDGVEHRVDLQQPESTVLSLLIDGNSYEAFISRNGSEVAVSLAGQVYLGRLEEPFRRSQREAGGDKSRGSDEIAAPMPGKVVSVLVEKGARVEQGDGLIIVEAMKMENELKAPRAGEVAEIYVQQGDRVGARTVLIKLT